MWVFISLHRLPFRVLESAISDRFATEPPLLDLQVVPLFFSNPLSAYYGRIGSCCCAQLLSFYTGLSLQTLTQETVKLRFNGLWQNAIVL